MIFFFLSLLPDDPALTGELEQEVKYFTHPTAPPEGLACCWSHPRQRGLTPLQPLAFARGFAARLGHRQTTERVLFLGLLVLSYRQRKVAWRGPTRNSSRSRRAGLPACRQGPSRSEDRRRGQAFSTLFPPFSSLRMARLLILPFLPSHFHQGPRSRVLLHGFFFEDFGGGTAAVEDVKGLQLGQHFFHPGLERVGEDEFDAACGL